MVLLLEPSLGIEVRIVFLQPLVLQVVLPRDHLLSGHLILVFSLLSLLCVIGFIFIVPKLLALPFVPLLPESVFVVFKPVIFIEVFPIQVVPIVLLVVLVEVGLSEIIPIVKPVLVVYLFLPPLFEFAIVPLQVVGILICKRTLGQALFPL